MVWLIPFLCITLLFAVIVLWGMFMEVISDSEDMKGVYKYYGLSLVIAYCILALRMVVRSL